jgi:hypothetical protein
MVGCVVSIPEIPRAKRRKKELCLYLDSFFTKRLSLGSDQPSASSGETARSVASSVLSVSSECGEFLSFFYTVLINFKNCYYILLFVNVVLKNIFKSKNTVQLLQICALQERRPPTHTLLHLFL